MSDANKHSAIKGYGDALKQEAELENARYKNDSSLRSSNDDMSDLFSSISEAAKSPSGRPRGIGASIAAGFSEGISTGYKMKSTNEKKEKYNKYNNVMSYLQKTQAEVTKQNKHYAEQEQRMETVKPFATGALEVAYSGMDYNQGNERMRNIIEQAKLADPSIKGDYLGYVPNSPIINMRDQNGNITAFSLSSLTGEDTVQRVQKNYIEGQKVNHDFQYKQDDTNIKKFEKGIPGGAYGTPAQGEYGSIPIKVLGGKGMTPFMQTINSEINLAKDIPIILQQIDEAEEIIKNNPKIGSGFNNWLSQGSVTKALMDKDLRNSYEKMNKLSDRVVEAYIKAKGSNITNQEREMIKGGLFDSSLLPESSKFNIKSIRKELAIAQERGKFASEELSKGLIATAGSFDEYRNSKQTNESVQSPQAQDEWSSLGKPSQ